MVIGSGSGYTHGCAGVVIFHREDDSGWVYPDINYCLPFTWILPPVLRFLSTRGLDRM